MKNGVHTKITKVSVLCFKRLKDPYYQGVAAGLSYYYILSIVPIFLVLSQMLGLIDISLSFLGDLIEKYVTADVSQVIVKMLSFKPVAATNIIFLFMALWAASKAQFYLVKVSNYTYSDGESTGKNFILERLRAIKSMVITLVSIAFVIVTLLYGKVILSGLAEFANLGSIAEKSWSIIRWPIGIGLYFMSVSYSYYSMVSHKAKYREMIPGSVFASLGMAVVTVGYSIYLSNMANYDLIYGALSSIVALMLWFYFLSWVMSMGIIVNKCWQEVSEMDSENQAKLKTEDKAH